MEYSKWTGQRNQIRKREDREIREIRYSDIHERSRRRQPELTVDIKGAVQEVYAWIKKNRRAQLVLLLCGILLVGLVSKGITNRILYREVDIREAFLATNSGCIETRLQVTADYGSGFLTEHDKQALLEYLAGALGIQMREAASMTENEISQIYTYTKQAKQAETIFKVVTLKGNSSRTYLYTELIIYEDTQYDILEYRDEILKAFYELGVIRVETTLQFLGAYDGQMSMSEWDRIADRMIEKLNGKVVYENRDPDLYTIYAYSALLPEYIKSNGKQVNIQVAMRYEQDNDRTVVYLATPVIRMDW